ncbi:MAG TPA: MG2 domain-containing protein, partial [Vicinamibacterales bacterium]
MTYRAFSAALLLFVTTPAAAQTLPPPTPLRIVSSGPTGEIATVEEANEIRVVFSEPMVPLGRVPEKPVPPFFHIAPAVAGSFRWSGTTVLIFTPTRKLPLATKYNVTIDPSTASASGRRLNRTVTFTFTTPTARLLQTNWYRPDGRYDRQPIIALRFNQPVKPADVAAHVSAHFEQHPFEPPVFSAAALSRLQTADPSGLKVFEAKVAAARAAASATAAVSLQLAADWDRKRFPPAPDLVVLQVTTTVPPDSWVRLDVDGDVPSLAGSALSKKPQDFTIKVNRTFLVDGFDCRTSCEPELSNPVRLRVPVKAEAFAAALSAADITDPRQERPISKSATKKRGTWRLDESFALTLEDGGLRVQPPASTWVATIASTLTAADGQTLGYTWSDLIENWHQRAFMSFGDGHGVWETGAGSLLPFSSRNFLNVRQWAAPVDPSQVMQTVLGLRESNFHTAPQSDPVERKLGVTPDKIQSHGLDLSKALKPSGTGIVWTAVEEGKPIEHATVWRDGDKPVVRASLVQVTNLGITVKDSLVNTLIFVTRLDTAAPVPGARVSIVGLDGHPMWTGTTGADGVVIAPETRLRDPRKWWQFAFVVLAEKDGDVAYLGSDWHEGITPWEFAVPFNLEEANPLLRGTVFSDRGVYRLGEDVHFKAVLRHNTADGIRLLADGTEVYLTVRDSRNRLVDERTIKVNAWSSAEWTFTLPTDGALGTYDVRAVLVSDRPKDKQKAGRQKVGDEEEELDREQDGVPWIKTVNGSFLVAAYRKPDFRVDVTLTGTTMLAGDPLKGVVTGRYLFGAPMPKRPTHWTFTRTPVAVAPETILNAYPADRWTFVGWAETMPVGRVDMASDNGELAANGQLPL